MYALVVVEGPDAGSRHALPDREPQLIGRSTEAIPLQDESVSRRHAELTPDEGRWWIRDLDSTNGTLVNDVPILDRTSLDPGDRIRCGDTVLVLAHLDEAEMHGRLRAPDPERHVIRLLDAGVVSRTGDLDPLFKHDIGGIADMATILAKATQATAIAILPVDERGGLRGVAEVRTPTGEPPTEAFDLPRDLISSVAGDLDGPPRVATVDERIAVAAITVGAGVDLRLEAGVRPLDRLWSEPDLALLEQAATIVGLRMILQTNADSAARLHRLAAMGEATAVLSHSIKNILQGMRGGADAIELALARDRTDLAKQGWAILARNLDRILTLSLNMLAFSKDRSLDPVPTNLDAIAQEAIDGVRSAADRRKVSIELRTASDVPPIPIDPDAIHQAILNLLGNAVEAVSEGGRVELRIRYEPGEARIVLEVADDGPGVPIDRRIRIFEPFYSTKGQRGTGLGLVVAQKLVGQHGGSLEILPQDPLGGAAFRMVLPATWEGDEDASG
ncbi:MAG: ATP-binding protein, partial [Planctomycetota bacterium]|nr:ATP-binding protein [Planctomycetota bacterium]